MSLPLATALRVFLPFALGYFLSYLFRVVNAVIAPDLVADMGVGPSELGLLTSSYFIAFASFQLPLGVLLDRYGPRRVEACLLVIAALGAFVFAQAQSLAGLVLGRALIGFGVAACLMAAFKAFVLWFPKELWPRINGFQMAAGGMGVLTATSPVEFALGFTDWRGIFTVLALLTLGAGLAVFFTVPEKESAEPAESFSAQIKGIGEVFGRLDFWSLAPFTTMTQATYLAIQSLWAGPWLKDVALFSRAEIANTLFWTAVSMVTGYIALGALAERLSRSGISVLISSVVGMAIFVLVQSLVVFEFTAWPLGLWMSFGFFGTAGILAYPALTMAFDDRLSGRVTTCVNLLVFVVAFAAQWGIGAIINLWPVGPGGNYANEGYQTGFAVMLGLQILSLIWLLISRRNIKPRPTS